MNPIKLEEGQYRINNAIKDLDLKIQNMNLSKAQEALAYQTIASLKKQGVLQQLDINLKKQGVQPGDNVLLRILTQGITQGKGVDWFKEKANNLAQWLKENLYE
jgi:hypothetical protein